MARTVTFSLDIDKGEFPHPKDRVLVMASVARAVCEEMGADPAEATMMLLTAAAKVTIAHTKPGIDPTDALADALGNAIIAAKEWFPISRIKEQSDGQK